MKATKKLMRSRRIALRFSQRYISEVLGVQGASVGHWETGRRKPCLAHAELLALLLEVPLPSLAMDWGGLEHLARWKPRGIARVKPGNLPKSPGTMLP